MPGCSRPTGRHGMGARARNPPWGPWHLQPLEATARLLTDVCTKDVKLITKPLPVAPNVLRRFLLSRAEGVAALIEQAIEIPAVSQRLSLTTLRCATRPCKELG